MKHLKLTFLLTVLMSMVGARAMADEFTVDGISYYNYDGDEVVLTSGSSCSGDVVIPETVTYNDVTYRVLCIGPGAFSNCSGLTSITIPNSVEAIANEAFYNCDALTSITIPNSVQTIDYSAFEDCSGLTSVNIGNGVEYIEHSAFSYCSSLTSITIPNSVVFIGNYAFQGCEKLSSLSIGNSVTNIGEYAFSECRYLTSITIPNSVTTIGAHAFENCGNLSSIIIPNSVTSIGSAPFFCCYDLSSIVVEAGNTAYDSRNNCNAIIEKSSNRLIQGCVNTIIPNSVTSIGDYAFCDCYNLTSILIPNSVTSIGDGAFYGCYDLTSILIPNSVTSIGMEAFSSTEWYENQSNGLIYAGKVAYGYKGTMPANTNIVLEEGTLGIAGKAFYYCSNLTSIYIPNSVKSIGDYSFYGCRGLTSITISNSVTSIGASAFSGCSGLTSVTISNSVTSIGERAFQDCSNIQSLTLGNSVINIDDFAFYGCNSLTSVTIPNSVSNIGHFAFGNSLTTVTVENSVPISIGPRSFPNQANATLYVPYGSKAAYKVANYWKSFKEIVEMELETTDISTLNNVIYLDEVQAVAGSQKTISIKMKNSAAIRGFQFNMTLPEGVTPATYSNGKIICSLSDARRPEGDQHTVSVDQQADGSYLFLCNSIANDTFTGNDGEVLTLKINIADNMAAGDYPITLSSIKLSETNISNSYETAEVVSKLTISDYELGDINGDNTVDVSDYIGVANHILGNTPAGFNALAADVNGDQVVDISDYIGVANIILTGSIYGNNASSRPFVENEEPTHEPQ